MAKGPDHNRVGAVKSGGRCHEETGTVLAAGLGGDDFLDAADDAKNNFTYPGLQYDHSDGRAIGGGYVYRCKAMPALVGQYIFGDIVNGRIFHAPVSSLKLGSQTPVQELTLLRNGQVVTMLQLVGTSNPLGRIDLRFGQDEAGEIYILSKQDGAIRKFRAAGAATS